MILITGFPYIRESYFMTFRHYPNPDQLSFLLPKIWKIKGGTVTFRPPNDPRVRTAMAFFTHSRYPVVGGLLKGWMPAFPLVLWNMRDQVDLVYSCSEPNLLTTLYYALASKILGKKHIVFSWENIPYWEKFHGLNWLTKKAVIKAVLALSDGIVCGNSKGKDIFHQLTSKPVTVIPMSGVDTETFARTGHSKTFEGYDWTDKVVFTFAGAIGYRKGIHHIIDAFKTVVGEMRNAHLVIAGSGEYEDEIKQGIKDSGVADWITRISWVDHAKLPRLLEASDVFLYPSIAHGGWEEQFGYSMAEASLMELPVITTESGSIDEVVVHEKTGLLVQPGNVGELAQAMKRLGTDPLLRERLGKAGREHISVHFSHQKVAGRFQQFFKQVS